MLARIHAIICFLDCFLTKLSHQDTLCRPHRFLYRAGASTTLALSAFQSVSHQIEY